MKRLLTAAIAALALAVPASAQEPGTMSRVVTILEKLDARVERTEKGLADVQNRQRDLDRRLSTLEGRMDRGSDGRSEPVPPAAPGVERRPPQLLPRKASACDGSCGSCDGGCCGRCGCGSVGRGEGPDDTLKLRK